MAAASAGKQQDHAGEERGDQPGLDEHLAGLAPELARQPGIVHGFHTTLGLALTARREADSRVIPGLEQADRPGQEQDEQRQPEASVGSREQE